MRGGIGVGEGTLRILEHFTKQNTKEMLRDFEHITKQNTKGTLRIYEHCTKQNAKEMLRISEYFTKRNTKELLTFWCFTKQTIKGMLRQYIFRPCQRG